MSITNGGGGPFRSLTVEKMSRLQSLKLFVNQRLNAAVEEIFGHFERTIIEYEEEMDRRHRKLLDVFLRREIKLRHADVQQLFASDEDVAPQQQEWSSSLDPDGPEPAHIKREKEEFWSGPEPDEADGPDFPFTSVKREDEEDRPRPSQLRQSHPTEGRGAEPLTSGSVQYIQTEDDCGSEPASHPDTDLLSQADDKTCNSPEPETDDSDDDWPQPGHHSGLNYLRMTDAPAADSGYDAGDKSLACSGCGETFCSKTSLTLHRKVHGGRPFSCSVCSKRFQKRSHLVEHFRIHTGERPFSCSVCNTSFTLRNTLVQHMRTHTGVKPFICSVCGKRFSQKGNMMRHLAAHSAVKKRSAVVFVTKDTLGTAGLRDANMLVRTTAVNEAAGLFIDAGTTQTH